MALDNRLEEWRQKPVGTRHGLALLVALCLTVVIAVAWVWQFKASLTRTPETVSASAPVNGLRIHVERIAAGWQILRDKLK